MVLFFDFDVAVFEILVCIKLVDLRIKCVDNIFANRLRAILFEHDKKSVRADIHNLLVKPHVHKNRILKHFRDVIALLVAIFVAVGIERLVALVVEQDCAIFNRRIALKLVFFLLLLPEFLDYIS